MRAVTHVGTSGWQYRHWKGVFYPDGLNVQDWLRYYAIKNGTRSIGLLKAA